MRFKPLPLRSYLCACLRYDVDTGRLFWRWRPRHHFNSDRGWNSFNTQFADTEAFTYKNPLGYRQGGVDTVTYMAHRVIWKMMTGDDPPFDIDHIDRRPDNNRWSNLRLATRHQNSANSVRRKGVQQIYNGRWRAYLTVDRKLIHLGYFGTEAEATLARQQEMARRFAEFAP